MPRFVAFDVETPNRANDRMSAIGITVIEDGSITDSFYSLVNPETDFDTFNTELTGISAETVRSAPTFPQLWTRIEPLMSSGLLTAHNAVFDMNVLKRCLAAYSIDWKPYARYACTVRRWADGCCPVCGTIWTCCAGITGSSWITTTQAATAARAPRFYCGISKPEWTSGSLSARARSAVRSEKKYRNSGLLVSHMLRRYTQT